MGRKQQRSKGKGKGGGEEKRPELRFNVGDRVKCWMGPDFGDRDELCKLGIREMIKQMMIVDMTQPRKCFHGTVVQQWWTKPGTSFVQPYQVRLDDGRLIIASSDTDRCVEKSDVPVPEADNGPLFQQPPPRDDCPICLVALPLQLTRQTKYWPCCGKVICLGCMVAADAAGMDASCPFCRAPPVASDEQFQSRVQDRIDKNDPEAMVLRGISYYKGSDGFPMDKKKANEWMIRAAELGLCTAHFNLGCSYWQGLGADIDVAKARHHLGISAMAGHGGARYQLGLLEDELGNKPTAYKHFMVGAKSGYADCLEIVKEGYMSGQVTKDDFALCLRASKDSLDEIKTEQREKARALYPWSPPKDKMPHVLARQSRRNQTASKTK